MRALRVGVIWIALSLVGCATEAGTPHRDLAPLWRDYLELPDERALAIAGDPRRDRWVAGVSGGHESQERAEQEALAQCRIRRRTRRLQEECTLYAAGDEIVWWGR